MSTGPMLEVTFDGQPAGTVFQAAKPRSVRVQAVFRAASQFHQLEVIVNGKVITVPREQISYTPLAGDSVVAGSESRCSVEIPIEQSSWIAVRCFEHRIHESVTPENQVANDLLTDESFSGGVKPAAPTRVRYAHTAPVYFEVDGPIKPRKREVNYFIDRMEQEIARHTGVLADDEVAEYRKALGIYQEIAKRAVE